MKALDLFCGGGGVAQGLLEAGFDEVVGIDLVRRNARVYPGDFVCGDATQPPVRLADFDFVWASPPCQRFSFATPTSNRDTHPDLIEPVRTLLADHPVTVIENVPGAPIRKDLVLTGPMVGLHRIMRRRHFELSWFPGLVPTVQYLPKGAFDRGEALTVTTSMSSPNHYYARKRLGLSGRPPIVETREAMGIKAPMTQRQVGEAVPPAYARFIGKRAIDHIKGVH